MHRLSLSDVPTATLSVVLHACVCIHLYEVKPEMQPALYCMGGKKKHEGCFRLLWQRLAVAKAHSGTHSKRDPHGSSLYSLVCMDSSSRRGRSKEDEAERFVEDLVSASCLVHHGQEEQQGSKWRTHERQMKHAEETKNKTNEETKERRRNRVGAENSLANSERCSWRPGQRPGHIEA
jgi:hypothetical protein